MAVITTYTADTRRGTHVWYVNDGRTLLLEAGTPENGWYRDILARPDLDFASGDQSLHFVATPLPNPAGHRRVRRLLAAKYGIRDWWIGLIFDTKASVAVSLDPFAEAHESEARMAPAIGEHAHE